MTHRVHPVPRHPRGRHCEDDTFRLRSAPLVLAVHLTLAGGVLALAGWSASAHAQATGATPSVAETPKRYDIPSGPLGTVISRFAGASGVLLAGSSELVQRRHSPGLNGTYTAEAAINALLSGTGLNAVRQQNGTYVLREIPVVPESKASAEGTLPTVNVFAPSVKDATTEGTGSYRARYTNTATKLDLSPRETPQTVSVVTRQQMDDFAMTSVDDALQAISGVFVADRGANGGGYYSRGFDLQSQYDGIPNPTGLSESDQNPQIDNAFLDRIEVLQGASGLLSGAGSPGGTVNLVRKRPTESFQAQVEVQAGSWSERRVVGDVSGPLIQSGRLRGRLVAVAENSGSFVDYAYRNRRGAYGIVEADLTETTTLSASIQHQKDKERNHYGVPFAADGSDAGLSRSSFFNDANSRVKKDYTLYTLGLEQKLAADWRLRAAYSYGRTNGDEPNGSYIWGDLDPATGEGMTIEQMKLFKKKTLSHALDLYVSGPVHFGGRTHELAFGFNGFTQDLEYQGSGYTASTPFNAYSFDPASLPDPEIGSGYSGGSKIRQLGVYGVGRFKLTDDLKLIAGARVSNYENKDPVSGATTQKESSVISPYAGLIYDINKNYSVYASYSDIFKPQSNQSSDGSTLKPVLGANYEVGVKGELLDKRLNVAAAVFRLVQSNLPKLDESAGPTACAGGACYVAQDKVISQGLELSAYGEIQTGWNLAASYTYVNAKYASGADNGKRYASYLPEHSLRIATSYKLPGTSWTLGGNIAAYSKASLSGESWVSGLSYSARQGGFAVVGLNAKYQINPKTELTVAVSNLFDRTYRAFLESRDYSTFGEPRKLVVNLRHRF
ncbi:TonB-dependent siderophore receptor [Ottowia sp. VDI28]|uniref:TonB-dependent siderophore receptor n=1 Tax=Ottowia sp. VDI28 TaxID=3133968 RepID=UPI003C308187